MHLNYKTLQFWWSTSLVRRAFPVVAPLGIPPLSWSSPWGDPAVKGSKPAPGCHSSHRLGLPPFLVTSTAGCSLSGNNITYKLKYADKMWIILSVNILCHTHNTCWCLLRLWHNVEILHDFKLVIHYLF